MIILSATGDLINLTRSAAMMRQSSLIFVPSNIEMILDHVIFQVQITAVYLIVNTDPTAEQGTQLQNRYTTVYNSESRFQHLMMIF